MLLTYALCLQNALAGRTADSSIPSKKSIDLKDEAGFMTMWKIVCLSIREHYHIESIEPHVRDHILVLWYFQKEISLSHKLNGQTVMEMQGKSYYFFETPSNSRPSTQQKISGVDNQSMDVSVDSQQSQHHHSLTDPSVVLYVPFVYCSIWSPELFDKDIFLHTTDQLSEQNLPKFVAQLHYTTYSMLGKYAKVVNEMRKLHEDFVLPPVETRTVDGVWQVKTSLDEIYAHAAIGPKAVLEEALWIDPETPLLHVPSKRDIPSALKRNAIFISPVRHHGADLVAPHAAEQYKASVSFASRGHTISSLLVIATEDNIIKFGRGLIHAASIARLEDTAKSLGVDTTT